MSNFYLTLLTLIPLAGAIFVALLADKRALIRAGGLGFSFATLAATLALAFQYDRAAGGLQFVEQRDWIPALHIQYFLGADGLSLLLLFLTGIVTPFALLALGERSTRFNVSLILLLQTTLIGTFTALNFIHWFLYYELSLVPAFFLIRMGGSAKATAAATQMFIYTLLGGFAMLLGFLAIHQATGSFNLIELADLAHKSKLGHALSASFHHWPWINLLVFGGIFLGLAVKVPVVPFHTWLPDAYTEAPAPVSILLTGLLSKMGVYGFLRLLLPLFPGLMFHLQKPLLGFALVTIIFGAFAALGQRDLKRIVAYSSINHLGYCLLGIFAVAAAGHASTTLGDRAAAMNGVLLQIFNHGLTAAALFCFIGFIETRSGGLRGLDDFGGLRAAVPVLTGLMGISIFSSLGLPGLNGFVGEFLIFKGSFALTPGASALAAIGLFVTALFLLTMIQRVFTGPLNPRWASFPDLSLAERVTVAPVIALMFVVGICPQLLITLFNQTVLNLLP